MPRFHPRYSLSMLYAGNDLALLRFLQDELEDCQVVGCPNGSLARLFITHINYAVLLFDEALPDATGRELADFARTVAQRAETPVVVVRRDDEFGWLAWHIEASLALSREQARRLAALRRELWEWRSRLTSLECCGW
jgi:hypothetical protein